MAIEYARDAFWQTLGYIAQETESDRELRTAGNFADFEKTMPHLPLSRLRELSVVDNVSSYLGKRNPLARPVDPAKHVVWLQDNTAYRPKGADAKKNNVWEAEFVCAYFVKNSGKDWGRVVADIADKAGLGEGHHDAEATIAKRLEPWMDAILPAHTVRISIGDDSGDAGDRQVATLGPSDRSGTSKTLIRTTGRHADGDTLTSRSLDHLATRHMTTTFAEPTGWAVISDIDDTIKITQTPSPAGILRSTFVDAPTPVAGMPALYAHIARSLDSPPFWYLSASPYNLYPFLRDFRAAHGFPAGPLLLRNASWMDLAGFLVALTAGTRAYKTDRMRDIHRMFPGRRFVLIGDSTQSDPEAYGDVAREFPGWVGAVFIRRVTGVAEIDRTSKNKPERFEKAFEGVERGLWRVFDDPREVYAEVDRLVGR
ncbi:Actin patch protein 1 [Diplodia seriata]|uniref:Actin patch protein 1 n=1 Tax=Diplodia seriata TaxID=420778 RepID=A0A1S8B5Q6_9PEZI|nr:Actin patch protein 1 [Diplodia seriata]